MSKEPMHAQLKHCWWAYEQRYGHKEIHGFKSLSERNAFVSEHNGLCAGTIGYRDFCRDSDLQGTTLIMLMH